FDQVRRALAAGDTATARAALRDVVATPDRPSRDHLQAWHELRALGETPDESAYLYGVGVDMPRHDGNGTPAPYRDGTARHVKFSGKVVVWEAKDDEVDGLVGNLLDAGAAVAARIGPWTGPRPPLQPGLLRMSMLCAGGLYFGQGPPSALSREPMAAPVVAAGAQLLQVLTRNAVSEAVKPANLTASRRTVRLTVMARRVTREHVVGIIRVAGLSEAADEAERELPDEVEYEQVRSLTWNKGHEMA